MNLDDPRFISVEPDGRLTLPPDIAARLGLKPGAAVIVDEEPNGIRLRRPVEHLAKLYLEPTSRCNLSCRTCMRNDWLEPLGDMSERTFTRVLEGLETLDALPSVFFGGFGEPLAHPRIVDMVARVKAIGVPKVELITNGCLLTEATSRRLIEAGLDTLWVSLDGIRPESYSDVRLGALLPAVLENIATFSRVRRERQIAALSPEETRLYGAGFDSIGDSWRLPDAQPLLGIAFVAMKRNIGDLPDLMNEAHRLGARLFLVTNVVPYTEELRAETLYDDTLRLSPLPTFWHEPFRMPVIDVNDDTRGALHTVMHGRYERSLTGPDLSGVTRRCPFVEGGSTAITWNGEMSACLPLMHSHIEYALGLRRRLDRYVVGQVADRSLAELWSDPGYVEFRTRVQRFDFAPCIACGGCNLATSNEEDCEGQEFPRCGACLWSHGLIRCP